MTAKLLHTHEQAHSRQQLNQLLAGYVGELPCNGSDSFSAVPVFVSPAYVEQMEQLCRVLHKALVHVVQAYFADGRIRAIYNLDAELENILRLASHKPYEVGLYRPDFLQTPDGQLKICEIGARYPLNGWMLSYYLNLICATPGFALPEELQAMPGQAGFVDTLYNRFSKAGPLVLVHDNEKGTEVFYLLKEFEKRGLQWTSAAPKDLAVENGAVVLNGKPVSQFILEMDREELRKFSPDVLQQIILSANYFNDVRTLVLVHDKRILAVLYNEAIMADYLPEQDYHFLRSFLVPTYSLNDEAKREEIISSKQNWLLKQNSGGRGIGIYVKDECSPQEWEQVLRQRWTEYMVQQHVQQQLFDYNAGEETKAINLVGMLLCHHDKSFGPGLFRGSGESVVNVHQGRGVIFPHTVSKH